MNDITARFPGGVVKTNSFRGIFAALALAAWNAHAAGTLPSGYTEVEYIQPSGNVRIVTDYTPQPNIDKIEAVVEFPTLDTSQRTIWCARDAWNTSTWTLFVKNSSGVKFRFDYGNTTGGIADPVLAANSKYTVTAASNRLDFASATQSGSCSHTKVANFTCGGPVTLFSSYQLGVNNDVSDRGSHRLYSFKVWRSGDLIHYFVPCKDMNSVATMVDICDNPATLANDGDGSFTAGSEGHYYDDLLFLSDDKLVVAGSPDNYGSPSPAYGSISGVAAGSERQVSCPATSTNASSTVAAICTGWKLYDAEGHVVSSGVERAFTYVHPAPAAYRRLEWQWAVTSVKGAVAADTGGSVSPSGEAWYAVDTPVTVTATPDSGNPFVCWVGTLPAGISASSASVTFTPAAPFDMTAMFIPAFHVATDGNDGNSGTKSSPLATIDAAVTVANAIVAGGSPSATVIVADGTYTLSEAISVDSPITIVGESGNRDAVVVRASANNRAFVLENAAATISGITVLGGGNVTKAGGNIYIGANGGIVTNCVVANGRGYYAGNIAMGSPSPTVTAAASSLVVDCVISNGTDTVNGSWDSAGNIFSSGGRIMRCVIADGYNQNANGGGNVLCKGATMENCLITGGSGGNSSATLASGVYVYNSASRIVNCTIVGNTPAGNSGVAVWLSGSATSAKLVNCVIYGNGERGQDVQSDRLSCFVNCAFSSNGANCADTVSPVTNLTDAAFKDYANGNYHPAKGGALANAGTTWADYTTYGATSATDLAGDPRLSGRFLDIGCYEAASGVGLILIVR